MEPPRSETLPELLEELASRYGERDCLVYGDDRLSYIGFKNRVEETARGLHRTGVRKGDKVAIWMGNQTEWLVLAFAASHLSAVCVAFSTWWKPGELAYALDLADVNHLVFVRKYISTDYLAAIQSLGDLKSRFPKLRTLICLGDASGAGADMDVLDYTRMVEGAAHTGPDQIAPEGITGDDVAFILFTSGSTSKPKAVQNLHRPLIRNLFQIGERMHLGPDDRVFVPISLFWGFGIANAVFATLTHGAALVLQHRFEAAEALGLIERERCTAIYATPNMAVALKDHPDRPQRDLSTLRTGLGMPAAASILMELGAAKASSLYGLTECYGNSAVSDAEFPAHVRSFTCGRALPNTEIKIADPLTHAALAMGEVGEITLRGYVMPGYYKAPEETAKAMDADGFFLTGDLGMVDADGFLHFRGRLKEMIKTGGINVSPAEVEDHLRSHRSVAQALVVGVEHPVLDEMVVAAIVPRPGHEIAAEELTEFCREHLSAYKVPRSFVLLQSGDIPLTDTGKPDKKTLQKRLACSQAGDHRTA